MYLYIPNKFNEAGLLTYNPYVTEVPPDTPLYNRIVDILAQKLIFDSPRKLNKAKALLKATPRDKYDNKLSYICFNKVHIDSIVETYSNTIIPLLKRGIIRDNLTIEKLNNIPLVYYIATRAGDKSKSILKNLSILIQAYDLIYDKNLWEMVKEVCTEIDHKTISTENL